MPFTKAQRLKGLKKQLRNLGYEVTRSGGAVADVEDDHSSPAPGGRGAKTVTALRARDQAW